MKREKYFERNGGVIREVAFTPKGGCPLKLAVLAVSVVEHSLVAFTPKGGCPLKLVVGVRVRECYNR